MDVDNNKHSREGQEGDVPEGDASHKKIKLGELEKELRDWTLFELFDGLAKQEDEDDLLDIVREIRKRLAGPSGLAIILSDQVRSSSVEHSLALSLSLSRSLTSFCACGDACAGQAVPHGRSYSCAAGRA
jgi:hypothetical protein